MISVRLPDGAVRQFETPITIAEVAAAISPKLAKAAIAGRLDGEPVDLSTQIEHDTSLSIITISDQEALEIIRRSTAYVLSCAVKILYPDTQLTLGRVIEHGFYHDFAYHHSFTPEILEKIAQQMRGLIDANTPISHRTVSRDQAIAYFRNIGEQYKIEIIESLPEHEVIKLYSLGSFTDLCWGPHVPNTGKLQAFKLLNIAGAYWRGDPDKVQLQRIYGTAWADQATLDHYLHSLADAEARDHRKLGKQLDLFHFQDEAPGMVFWHPKGWSLWQQIAGDLRHRLDRAGYHEICTPLMIDRLLWERSGHWQNFHENMFTTESEKRDYAIKPMNCPGHVQVFNQRVRSYRDLPLRLAEFGACHRNEPSGALHGLMRVRGFVQDDAHIFCTEDQIIAESISFNELAMRIYRDFGFEHIDIKLSLRPQQRAGDDAVWTHAEQGLRDALTACNLNWEECPGEGAFYGPKIEYHIRDALDRSWQCGTLQLDFVLPQRLNAEYIAADNHRHCPVMLHRAVFGSMERFIGILLEHYAGALPVWLAPVQAIVINIASGQANYAQTVAQKLKEQGWRVEADLRSEKINYKIREHTQQKIPYLLIVGDRERDAQTIAVRARGGKDRGVMSIDAFMRCLRDETRAYH
jgi:threonyl-tRNA synthetase